MVFFLFREAWKSLGKMSKEKAMIEYISEVDTLYPSWLDTIKVSNYLFTFNLKLLVMLAKIISTSVLIIVTFAYKSYTLNYYGIGGSVIPFWRVQVGKRLMPPVP